MSFFNATITEIFGHELFGTIATIATLCFTLSALYPSVTSITPPPPPPPHTKLVYARDDRVTNHKPQSNTTTRRHPPTTNTQPTHFAHDSVSTTTPFYSAVAQEEYFYEYLSHCNYEEQLQLLTELRRAGGLSNLQYSLLNLVGTEYPTQVEYDRTTCLEIATLVYADGFERAVASRKTAGQCPSDFGSLRWCKVNYPIKQYPGAGTKQGMHAHDAFEGIIGLDRNLMRLVRHYWYMYTGMTDDQVAASLCYLAALRSELSGRDLIMFSTMPIINPTCAKSVTVALKGLGFNASKLGSMLVEANTLTGRGIGSVDLEEEIRRRCGTEGLSTVVAIPEVELREAIRRCFELELKGYEHMPFEEWYKHRWAKSANGSHSRRAGRNYVPAVQAAMQRTYSEARSHRKAVLESIDLDNALRWDGKVFVSPSLKMEHGKTRALFSCDTLSSLFFTWLFSQAEDNWRNIDAILDPGRMGTIGMGALLYKMKEHNPVMLMADYDDFNSQHTLAAQQMVVDELCKALGLEGEIVDKLIASFDRMYIMTASGESRVSGTLMSGHRGTSFINTVLNYSYMDVVHRRVGVPRVAKHVGDDIASGFLSVTDAARVLNAAEEAGLRLNRVKQSIGKFAMEFLRVAYDSRGNAYGYVARAIASYISGNWSTTHVLSANEVVTNGIGSVYTICNRAQDFTLYRMFVYGFGRRTQLPVNDCVALLSGMYCCNGSPTFGHRQAYNVTSVDLEPDKRDDYTKSLGQRPTLASVDYASTLTDKQDLAYLHHATKQCITALALSSYYKDMKSSVNPGDASGSVVLRGKDIVRLEGECRLTEVMQVRTEATEVAGELTALLARTYGKEKAYELYQHTGGQESFRTWARKLNGYQGGYNSFGGALGWADMCNYNGRVKSMKIFHDFGAYHV